ncbi:MAG TPA: lasso peptide biosynthesis B2 protein [Pyrinomonadaceae bacterium]|nr:lasso peptide biosynthesis B2 protein [Pyrinomonadaceae bacterium]
MPKFVRLILRITQKFARQPAEAWLLCRMAWWVAVLSIVARVYSLPRALEIVAGNEKRNGRLRNANQEQLARSIDLLLSANILMFKPICWKRAAVLRRYLLRSGIPARIVFGVRNDNSGTVDGHAWLEAEGRPILESSPPEYVVTYSFP